MLGCSSPSGGAGGTGGFPCREREGQGCPSPRRSCHEPVRAQPAAPPGGTPPFPGSRGARLALTPTGLGRAACSSPGPGWHCPRYCSVATTPRGGAFGTRHRAPSGTCSARPGALTGPRDRTGTRCPPAAHLCRPPAALGLCATVVHRPRPQGLAGIEVHGIRLLPLDVLESHCRLQRGPGMSPRAVPLQGELVALGEVPASSLVCRGGHCWGKARGTGNPTSFTKDWLSQQRAWTAHRAQMQRGGDTVWAQGHPQACSGAPPQARTVPPKERGVLTS